MRLNDALADLYMHLNDLLEQEKTEHIYEITSNFLSLFIVKWTRHCAYLNASYKTKCGRVKKERDIYVKLIKIKRIIKSDGIPPEWGRYFII